MTLNDMFHIYAMKHGTETAGMLQDYILDNRLDREELNAAILLELGDRIPYYNDTDVLKYAIDNWFAIHKLNIKRLLDALLTEYDFLKPKEEWEDITKQLNRVEEVNKDVSNTKTYNNLTTERRSDESNTRENSSSDSTTNQSTDTTDSSDTTEISAYNASTYQPQGKVTTDGTNTSNSTTTGASSSSEEESKEAHDTDVTRGSVTETEAGIDRDADINETENSTRHFWGRDVDDIASLVESEMKLAKFNIYTWIVNELGEKICLGIF